MAIKYNYVDTTSVFKTFPVSGCVAVEFVSLLSAIRYQKNYFLLELNNFNLNAPNEVPHLVKLRCTDANSDRLARMVIALVCQWYGIVLPELQAAEPFAREKIHTTQLCFLQCKGLYMAGKSGYSVFLEDAKPLTLEGALRETRLASPSGKTIAQILENLTRMHRDSQNGFQFDFAQCPALQQYVSSVPVKNPLFSAAAIQRYAVESQNEFNSMADTQEPLSEEDEFVPASKVRRLEASPREGVLLPGHFDAPEGTVLTVSGSFLAVHPMVDLMYFLPSGWERPTKLKPGVNCIEIAAPATALDRQVSLQIERTRWELPQGVHSLHWKLKTPAPPPQRRDPLLTFNQLRVSPREVKYVSMLGLLVSCTFEQAKYVSIVFTDFTSNPIPQKYLFDRFLVDFEKKLDLQGGFRTIMYQNQFREFDSKLVAQCGRSMAQLLLPGTENASHCKIVCRMSLKLQMYNDKLNAIVRQCEPVAGALLNCEERQHLWQLQQRAQEVHQFELSPQQDVIPGCQVDTAQFELRDGSNLQELQIQGQVSPEVLYVIDARILRISRSEGRLELLVTNDIITDRFVDPKRLLRIEIWGSENLAYFAAIPGAGDERQLVGNECAFRLARGLVGVRSQIGVLLWCPVECTFEELSVKKEAHSS